MMFLRVLPFSLALVAMASSSIANTQEVPQRLRRVNRIFGAPVEASVTRVRYHVNGRKYRHKGAGITKHKENTKETKTKNKSEKKVKKGNGKDTSKKQPTKYDWSRVIGDARKKMSENGEPLLTGKARKVVGEKEGAQLMAKAFKKMEERGEPLMMKKKQKDDGRRMMKKKKRE